MARRGRKRSRATQSKSFWSCVAVFSGISFLVQAARPISIIAGTIFTHLIVPAVSVVTPVVAIALAWYLRRGFIAKRRYRDLSRLRMLSPIEFERHVAEFYRRRGFRVRLTKVTGDQGIDVLADGKDGRIGIQVKQYINAVGNDAVQQVVAGLAFHRCSHGVVVTTSRFTPAAKALARANGVDLIDGATYVTLVARQLGSTCNADAAQGAA